MAFVPGPKASWPSGGQGPFVPVGGTKGICMVFILPTEYACQEDEDDEEMAARLVLQPQ